MPVQLYRTSRVGILRIGCFTVLAVGLAFTFWSATATATTDPVVVPGDANLDGVANLEDIEGFAIAIRAPDVWLDTYRATEAMRLAMGDFNADGSVNNGDSESFGQTVGAGVTRPGQPGDGVHPSLDDFPAGLIGGVPPQRVVPGIDVDIDSDNNNTTIIVGRTPEEEQVEDIAPGKILLVNDDDDDRNGVADQNQAGRIATERDDLVPLVVDANRDPGPPLEPDGINYRLSFPSAALRVWRYRDRGVAGSGPGGEELTNGAVRTARLLGDMNCNGVVNVADIGLFVTALTNPNAYRTAMPDCDIMNADMNMNGVVSVGDNGSFVAALTEGAGFTPRFAPQWLYVEGLQQSSTGGDRTVTAEADINNNGMFDGSDSVRATTVRITATPNTGMLGTPIMFSVNPTVAPMTFTSAASVRWTGNFVPQQGSATSPFSVDIPPAHVVEAPNGQSAQVAYGAGVISLAPTAVPTGLGVLQGHASINFTSTLSATRQFDFAPALAGYFAQIDRDESSGVPVAPLLGNQASSLRWIDAASRPNPPSFPEQALLTAFDNHYCAVVAVAENSASLASLPASMTVDVVVYLPSGAIFARVDDLVLTQLANDSDPTRVFFTSNLLRPLVVVNYPLNPSAYPNVTLLRVPTDGQASIGIVSQNQ